MHREKIVYTRFYTIQDFWHLQGILEECIPLNKGTILAAAQSSRRMTRRPERLHWGSGVCPLGSQSWVTLD